MTRVVNLKHDAFDIRIDRQTPLGNRFHIGRDGTRAEVIEKHMREWRSHLARSDLREAALVALRSMKGKRLGCHCKPLACHGDNYVQLIAEFCP